MAITSKDIKAMVTSKIKIQAWFFNRRSGWINFLWFQRRAWLTLMGKEMIVRREDGTFTDTDIRVTKVTLSKSPVSSEVIDNCMDCLM